MSQNANQARYLVSITRRRGDRPATPRRLIWEGTSALALDHPSSCWLERGSQGLRLRLKDKVQELTDSELGEEQSFELWPEEDGASTLLTLKKAATLQAAFLPTKTGLGDVLQSELRVSSGALGQFSGFQALARKYIGRIESRKLFVIRKKKDGYELKALSDGLSLRFSDGNSEFSLMKKEIRLLSSPEVETLILGMGLHWWRLSRVVERPLLALAPTSPSQCEIEARWLRTLNKKLAIGCVAAALLLLILPKAKDLLSPEKDEPLPPTTLVSLKKPKVIEKVILHKAEPQPVARAAPPRQTHPEKAPIQKRVAKVPPPAPAPPKVDEAALLAKQKALAQANMSKSIAKSLNFLSSAPAKTVVVSDHSDARYKTLAQAVPRTDGSPEVLSRLAQSKAPTGPIQTEGARTMSTKIAVGGSKTLNEVQGRVSLSSLAASGQPGDSVDSLTSSKGMSVSGDGSLAQSEIERVLAKYLQRFQYCYEKALLSDSSLAGHVLVQWTIGSDGASSEVKVLRSQLNNAGLHQCLSTEISKVRFPAPQGGSVLVKYPFAFSSTTL